ncbi:MAG: HyaD/HybD family hydrogenase maturation endopeptidase [Deltaproteobacteria bacterium]|uniref:HyaD/HybD family hydrogenase maturation endopeptidase n=1 Tax=Candidatus Zymogenus saltonus TaxID=2844893 RepID=A0A9D8PPS8_9DELT|nr:HyaD/HybD family hydrogenase maturation endopeptidase [Candidatus Zymogenus saltonus]
MNNLYQAEPVNITVMGLGNILLADEGFGVHFVRWFGKRYRLPDDVMLVDGGTLGFGLLDIVTSTKHLIVIDVLKADDDPGSLYRFSREEMELNMPEPTSAHEVEFVDILIQAEMMDSCPEVVFLCIVPKEYGGDLDLKMTPLMREKFPKAEELLLKELSNLNIVPESVKTDDA